MLQEPDDDLLLHRKAAALAWYRHGRRGSSAARAGRLHSSAKAPSLAPPSQASRFKTEAEKVDPSTLNAGHSLALLSLLPQQQITETCFRRDRAKDAKHKNSPWDCGSSLYDSFDLLCLSNQLGRCLTTVHAVTATPLHLLAAQSPPSSKLPPAVIHGTPYVPRSIPIPRFIPFTRSSKRSPLIHPFSSGTLIPAPSRSPRPQQPPSQDTNQKSGFRKVFQSLFKTFHISAPDWTSEESKQKLAAPRTPGTCSSAGASEPKSLHRSEDTMPQRTKNSSRREQRQEEHVHHHHHSHHHYHHHFRNEGFRTISKPTKTGKWLQPGTAGGLYPLSRVAVPYSVPKR